jgi:hypothetical protein
MPPGKIAHDKIAFQIAPCTKSYTSDSFNRKLCTDIHLRKAIAQHKLKMHKFPNKNMHKFLAMEIYVSID